MEESLKIKVMIIVYVKDDGWLLRFDLDICSLFISMQILDSI